MPKQPLVVIILVLARPLPISRLAVRWSSVITSVPKQAHAVRAVGVHVEVAVPFAIAASRYLQFVAGVALRSSPHVNVVGAT